MAFLDAFTAYAVIVNSTLFDQVMASGFQGNPNVQRIMADGEPDPTYAAVMSIEPRGTLTTTAINKALLVCGIDGLPITTGLDIWLQKVGANSTRATGASHAKISIDQGMVVPRRITATREQPATYELEVIGVSDDGTAPHSITAGAALTGSPTTNEAFTLGPCLINNTAVAGVQQIEIDFGIEVRVEYGDGGPFPRLVYIQARQPTITIRVLNAAAITGTSFINGQAIASATRVTLLKLTQNGLRAGAGDVVVTANDGTVQVNTVGGDGTGPYLQEIVITPVYDGTNDVLAFSRTA